MRKAVVLLASMALAVLLASGAVWADTFTVKNLKGSGSGSLRAAITAANKEPGRDVITFAPSARGAINLKSELPTLRGALMIRGPGADKLTVRRAVVEGFRIFRTAEGSTVTISDLTISNGLSNTGGARRLGGGISNGGKLTVRNSLFSGNEAKYGGGIYNSGDLRVENTIFSGNSANFNSGGGIQNIGGKLTVESSTFSNNSAGGGGAIVTWGGGITKGHTMVRNSTFSGNEAKYGGGAIISGLGSTLGVVNSTFSGNRAGEQGGAIYGRGAEVTVSNSTISGNTAGLVGGGIFKYSSSSFSLRMSIIARNEASTAPDASGAFSSRGYNLIGNTTGATGFGATDLQNVEPGLDPQGLQDNGGRTRTIALVSSSPAIDAVEADCPPPATDQRGIRRPKDGNGDGVARCDIGAYERRAAAQ